MSTIESAKVRESIVTLCAGSSEPRLRCASVHVFDTVASTMDTAREHEPTAIVIALTQTAGRGRAARTWVSPAGSGIYLSWSLDLELPERQLSALPLAVGIAVSRALSTFGVESKLKWPNDVIVDGRKAAGILLERGKYVVIGIGLNLDAPGVRGGIGVSEIAKIEYRQMLAELLERLFEVIREYEAGHFEVFRAEWESNSWLNGQEIRYARDGVESSGVVCGVSGDGALIVRDAGSGSSVMLYSGDVHLISGEHCRV